MHLFEPLTIRGLEIKNRIMVSPMCQYSSVEGYANDWHLVHLGSRAIGGVGIVTMEATAVEAIGRISPDDMGIYDDGHIEFLTRITRFIREHGSVAAIQLAHAGRKGSTSSPWKQGPKVEISDGGWIPVGPTAAPFSPKYPVPHALSIEEIHRITAKFAVAAKRAIKAGFQLIEIHAAHGYLLNEFLSPLSNTRTDEYGGSFENRIRFLREVIEAIRNVVPEEMPLFLRISATDWAQGGWNGDDSVELAKIVGPLGIDLIDCSTGGNVPKVTIPIGPGYQVPFAEQVKKKASILTAAVGMITEPKQAEEILENNQADLIVMAREFLRDPYWPAHAAKELGEKVDAPLQYNLAWK